MPPLSSGNGLASTLRVLFAALLPIWFLSHGASANTYTVAVTQSPGGASAGAAFSQQPIVTIYDSAGEIATDYVGSVYVSLEESPTGFEVLWFNGTDVSEDGFPGRVYFVDGLASFEGLYINDQGSGFVIGFIVLDDTDASVTSAESSEFEVSIGSAYQISLSTYPGSATGGSGFSPQPVVAAKDIGGNTVTSYGDGQVTAYLVDTEQNPNPTGAILRGTTTRSMNSGLVQFTDLYINEAGSPYLLAFEFSGADLDGTTVVYSNPFAVGIGEGASMEMLETVTDGYTYGGVAFQVQPRIQVLDAGGNLLTGDSESIVEVTFTTNPSAGKMTPEEYASETLVAGICSFALLSIDKIGNGYELLFTLKEYTASTNSYTSTGITLSSAAFDVTLGPPYQLVVDVPAGGAAAGGSAFTQQPVVSLRDVGGNIITTDSSSVVTAIQVESLSTQKSVLINTQSAPEVRVEDVYYSGSETTFTGGDSLSVFVKFSQEVKVTPSKGSPVLEFAALTNSSAGASSIYRYLTATCVTLNTVTNTLEFELDIPEATDVGQPVFPLMTRGPSALRLRNSLLLDNLDRTVNYTLPVEGETGSLTSNVNISVDLRTPYVTAIELFMENSTEGVQSQMVSTTGQNVELGAGHLVSIQVSFSQAVTVSGIPVIPLNLTHRNESLMGTVDAVPPEMKIRQAKYTSGSGTNTLTFEHVIRLGDMSGNLDMPDGLDGKNRSILLEGGYIRRYSTSPTLTADLNLTSVATLGSLGNVVIDTMAPKVDSMRGVTTTASDGLYYAGDTVYLEVEFDKPVVATSGVYLEMSTGLSAATQAYYYSGSYSRRLTFEYTIQDSEDKNCMDVHGMNENNPGLIARGSQYIRRAATNLVGDADASLVGARRLNESSCLEIYGVAPVVQGYYLNHRSEQGENGTVYTIGDSVFINVTFDRPVVVLEDIKLWVYVTNSRAATYKSGNHSRTIVFEYAVQLGDTFTRSTSQSCIYCFKGLSALCATTKSRCAKTMGLRYSPNALVGTVHLDSTNPTVAADLTINPLDDYAGTKYGIPVYAYSDSYGILNNSIVEIDTANVRASTITGVTCTKETGLYGAGENIYFEVTFTDEITIYGASLPQLWMSTNAGATYYGGSGSDTWTFFYRTQEGDNSSSLGLMDYPGTDSFIKCNKTGITSYCSIVNGNNKELNLTTTDIGLGPDDNYINTGVRIDTSAPRVVDVYTTKNTSRYPNEVYTVGEEIDIIVEFDLPLKVSGTPVLYIETGDDDTEVEYAGMEGLYKLIFKYEVQEGHMAGNLTYADTDAVYALTAYRKKNALTTNYGQAAIRRYSSVGTTDANLTLVQPPPPLARNDQVVTIDTSQIPKVDCGLRPGLGLGFLVSSGDGFASSICLPSICMR